MKRLLFFGDSLTDMSRARNKYDTSVFSYGTGFVFFLKAYLDESYPNEYEVINRGIGGNRIVDLARRYKKDVIEEKPDVVTILIGVNEILLDCMIRGMGTPLEKFKKIYKEMLDDIKRELPEVRFILMEPFYLDAPEIHKHIQRFDALKNYQDAIKEIAKEYNAVFLSLQKKLSEEATTHKSSDILYDGIHTNALGAKIIADEWMKGFRL